MSFTNAIRWLNKRKKKGEIRDYVIIGAVAAIAYLETITTQDLDVIILADTDEEYFAQYGRLSQAADSIEGMHHVVGGISIQVFPTSGNPLFASALANAKTVNADGVRTKVASVEHLVVLALQSFRLGDQRRIHGLLNEAGPAKVDRLIKEFDDDDQTLADRLRSLLRP